MNPLSQTFRGESHPAGGEVVWLVGHLIGGTVQGFGIVKELAEIESELAKKLDEARRSAEGRVAKAEEEARRILAETDTRIHQMEETLEARIAQESQKYAKEAQARSEAEAQRIRRQADPNIDQAVDFLLSEVMP